MKRLVPLVIIALFTTFTACDDLIPDIDKVVEQSYTFTIDAETPVSVGDTIVVDITQYQEFADYEQYISGYTLNSITYIIEEFDASEEMYFSGVIEASDTASVTTITVGEISPVNLAELYSSAEEMTMDQDAGATEQIVAWLDDPGNFEVRYMFNFINQDASDYVFTEEDQGKTVKITVRFNLTIMTGFSGSELDA